ncbi:AbiTii domain-containing protein [Zavarzinella formosa]|uniref:AbiTii domain-containing protein n=1 Tax=Zavarzinella formosa TaxID=360055 RepID=UPI00037F328F|nr:hypothetical protein [Zavarzinella formosa]
MDLINELQISAERDDVLVVLRKTQRLASKLNLTDISDWLQSEQEGYATNLAVPPYRKIATSLVLHSSGYIPAGFGRITKGVQELSFNPNVILPVRDSISTIMDWIKGNQDVFVRVPIDSVLARNLPNFVDPEFVSQVCFMYKLNASQINAIPDRIKNKVLTWACSLEQAGIKGDALSFDEREKQIAHNITFNITESNIGQLNNMGANHKGA